VNYERQSRQTQRAQGSNNNRAVHSEHDIYQHSDSGGYMAISNLLIALILIVVGIVTGITITYLVIRINEILRVQRDTRLPYKVCENLEDSMSILWREDREDEIYILHLEQELRTVKARRAERTRAIEKLQQARGNGQKKGNGK
jgi:hypothetical protein